MELPETVTQEQLAGILGLSPRQLRNLRAEVPPIEKEGRELVYPFPACLRNFVRYREGRVRAKLRGAQHLNRADPGEIAPVQEQDEEHTEPTTHSAHKRNTNEND